MTALPQSTRRRLKKLQQIPSVWEGDRRPLAMHQADPDWLEANSDDAADGECILWVDGSQGMVRAMDVVTADTGPEAVARTLIRAMEYPHNPGLPARPQKIVVRDRELQFFLRGVLQDLGITLDYAPELPLIDEIFQGLQEAMGTRPPHLPPQYADALNEKAFDLWKDAPWEILADHQILAIQLNRWDIETFYVSVMGMLGMEYGLLFYRSLDSLKRFRQQALLHESLEQMQEAFLGQDCLFLTFEDTEEEDERFLRLVVPSPQELQPIFGNLHPLEGLRSFLYDDEAAALLVALEALHRFLRQNRRKFTEQSFPDITGRYRIPTPAGADATQAQLSVKVSTLPELATELLDMGEAETDAHLPMIRDDLVPDNSFLSLGMVPWDVVDLLRETTTCNQPQPLNRAGDGLPVILIQTSRPKAQTLVQNLQSAGGLQAICFNPGEDSLVGERYDLGLLQTNNGELYLFGEFEETDPTHAAARKKWDQRCKNTRGYCGLIIAKGLTGAARGNPQIRDMVALFEARSLSSTDLGLGTLQLRLAVDWP